MVDSFSGSLLLYSQILSEEWDLKKNGDLKPENVSYVSNKRAWWLCSKFNHSFRTPVSRRSLMGQGCPYCANQKLLTGFNDLQTVFPYVAKDWHSTKNGDLKPTDILYGSSFHFWWECAKCKHEWKTTPSRRTHLSQGCPKCASGRSTSFGEQALFYYMKILFPDAENRAIVGGVEADIFIPLMCFASI